MVCHESYDSSCDSVFVSDMNLWIILKVLYSLHMLQILECDKKKLIFLLLNNYNS